MDAEARFVKDPANAPDSMLESVWKECACSACAQWRRQQRGRELCVSLSKGQPIADALHEVLFDEEPLEWNRLPSFQLVTIRLLAQTMLKQQLTSSATLVPSLSPPGRHTKYHVFCSPNNPGALEVLLEMAMMHGQQYQVREASDQVISSAALSNRISEESTSSPNAVEVAQRTAQRRLSHSQELASRVTLRITRDVADISCCSHAFVYLTKQTWESGAASDNFASLMMGMLVDKTSLVLAHEMPGIKEEQRQGCEFGTFFRVTPKELIDKGCTTRSPLDSKAGSGASRAW
jgi:hypothetical protein